MSTITRRQVATGAAWAVPVIAVGAAAPAMAASAGCTSVSAVTITSQTSSSATLGISFTPPLSGSYILEILSVSGVSFVTPATTTYPFAASPLTLTLTRSNSGVGSGVVTVSYNISVSGQPACFSGSFTFDYTR